MAARSTNCRILVEAITQTYFLFKYEQSISYQTTVYPLAVVLAGLTISSSSVWSLSDDCSRFIVENTAFYLFNNTYVRTNNTFSTTDNIVGDNNLNYIVSSGNIWQFDTTQNKYIQLTNDAPFLGTYLVTNIQDRLVVSSQNSDNSIWSVKVIAYSITTNGLSSFFTYNQNFSNMTQPRVSVATGLDKVVVYGGQVGSSDPSGQVDAFYLDYSGATNISINFPMSTVSEIAWTFISVNADFLYVRQTLNNNELSNTTYTAINRQEYVYYLNKGYLPQLLIQNALTTQ